MKALNNRFYVKFMQLEIGLLFVGQNFQYSDRSPCKAVNTFYISCDCNKALINRGYPSCLTEL